MAAFDSILIANRGEIAARVIRTARAQGYGTVAVFSDADADAPFVRLTDAAVALGGTTAAESYLDIGKIVEAAKASGAGAVHPGYGFLAENADFAAACAAAGLVFIGPSAEVIALMGDKAAAKRRMEAAGVPCVPGYQGDDQSDGTLIAETEKIGFPVMVKAAAGGGGKGMRRVDDRADLEEAIASARSEAEKAFGSGVLILERAVERPRHVEIQVFADAHGNAVHLGERDCSVQRRHQKIIEESPSPAVDAELRDNMGAAVVAAAQAIGYLGAGTVEFLLDQNGEFYFMEMNTRLQVEHPVTEMVLGLDLVAWQLDVAAGAMLPLAQDEIAAAGHAIEVRLYAKDPAAGFLPQSGTVGLWRTPEGQGVRVDHALESGIEISPHYDPMIAKIIAHGRDREEARRRLMTALRDTAALGIATNKRFLFDSLAHPVFVDGGATTAFVEEEMQAETATGTPLLAAAVLFHADRAEHGDLTGWHSGGRLAYPLRLEHAGERLAGSVAMRDGGYAVTLGEQTAFMTIAGDDGQGLRYTLDGREGRAGYLRVGDDLWLDDGSGAVRITDVLMTAAGLDGGGAEDSVRAPMNGAIIAVDVKPGDAVTKGQRLAVLEAMKMEHRLVAPADGTVAEVPVAVGDQVATRAVVIRMEPPA